MHEQAGWTLPELLTALLVSSMMTTMAVPAYRQVIDRNQLAVSANRLLSDMAFARERAIASGRPVTFCAGNATLGCTGDWSAREWIVFVDRNHDGRLAQGDTLQSTGDLRSAVPALVVTANGPFGSAVVFDPIGSSQTANGAFAAGTLRVCLRGGSSTNATDLALAASGRVRAEAIEVAGNCPPP